MKKKFLFWPLAAALAFTACSDDEPAINGGSEVADGNGRFLSVSIITNETGNSRYHSVENNIPFEDGVGAENVVKDIRIYFFNSAGDPVNVKNGTSVNFYDVPASAIEEAGGQIAGNTENDPLHNETAEKRINAVIIVDPGEKVPAQLVAVINPKWGTGDNELQKEQPLSLSELRNKFSDYALATGAEGSFMMTNSVYLSSNGIVRATAVSPDNYQLSKDAALDNPVEIYVERVVAKVRLSIGSELAKDKVTVTQGDKTFTLYKLYKKEETGTGDNITETVTDYKIGEGNDAVQAYVRLDAWDVTGDLGYEYLSKHIVASWPATYMAANTFWNSPVYHRSYWADVCNPVGKNNFNQYYAYNSTTKLKNTKFDGTENVFCNENAERPATLALESTKVLIKATICDEKGNPLCIAQYGGNTVINTPDFKSLKQRYITMLTAAKAVLPWKKVNNPDGKITYKQLSADDLDFIPFEKYNQANTALKPNASTSDKAKTVQDGRYYVYACLSETALTEQWYTKVTGMETKDGVTTITGVDESSIMSKEALKLFEEELVDLGKAKVWKDGQAYYYTPIKHIGEKDAKDAVVRNHIYALSLSKIYGIGTPVYDPSLTIIPEKPENEETFVAARFNILSWRMVSNEVILDWD